MCHRFSKLILLLLIAVSSDVAGEVMVRCGETGWYRYGGQTFFSNGGIEWNSQTGKHSRNTCATGKCFIVWSDGIHSDEPTKGVALHENELKSLGKSGQEFVGEEFTSATKEQSFWLETPGGVSGSEATVRIKMVQAGFSVTSASIKVNDTQVGTLTMSTPSSGDAGCASTGEWKFTMNSSGRVKVTIIYNVLSASGYLDWIEVNYEDGRSSVEPTDVKDAEVVGEVSLGRLKGMGNAEYLIITDPEFQSAAEALGELHQFYDGMSYAVVTQQEIFNDYSEGTPSLWAYKDFLTQMAGEGTKYVVLFGDGCYDNRGITRQSGQNNYWRLLTYQSVESYAEGASYCSDDWFGAAYEGAGKELTTDTMNLAVGRINAYTVDQAWAYVGKVEKYLQNSDLDEWKNTAIFIADDGDNNIHMSGADQIAEKTASLYPELLTRKLYMDSYKQVSSTSGESYPVLKRELDSYIDNGVLMITYVGHGGYANLSNEQIISYTDMVNMKNKRLPWWITATCNFSRFDDTKDSGGEIMCLNSNGGAIGLISTTRTVYSGQNEALVMAVTDYILKDGVSVGEALRRGKNARADIADRNRLSFALLGDPALRMTWAWDRDVKCSFDADTVGALDVVTISGEVRENGVLDESFEGYVHVTVYDKEETIKTLANDAGSEPFEYQYRTNPVYKGKTIVSEGQFQLQFVVPKDIKYNCGTGRVVMYAWDETRGIEGNGYNEEIVIGGEGKAEVVDSVGPAVWLSFNTTLEQEEYQVGENALLIARMSDENGINTVGSGIGHDLMMWLDDETEGTVLNNYYESDMGTYKSGMVKYELQGLSEGRHKIRFRCWDMANNSAVAEKIVNVTVGQEMQIVEMKIAPNPATDWVEIEVTGDAPETENDISVEIFDIMGRKVWAYEESKAEYEVGGKVVIRWNLGGGDASGVYVARVRLGKSSVKVGKIVVK